MTNSAVSPLPNPDLGLIYIFTGNGKGKTSAAIGTAMRGVAQGWKVDWIAWYKNAQWDISEYRLPDLLQGGNLEMFALGKGFYIQEPEMVITNSDSDEIKVASVNSAKVTDTHSESEHHQAAQAALQFARERLAQNPGILVLDEICNAISDKLIKESDVIDVLSKRGSTHIILTGRSASKTLMADADLVSEITARKHPYDAGKLAVAGLDF